MRKIFCTLLAVMLLLSLTGCSTVEIKEGETGKVVYHYNGVSFEEDLTPEETAAVIQILNGKPQNLYLFEGIPSCGFDRDIAIVIGGTRYALARDKCGTLQNCSNLSYITVSEAERQTLEAIFTIRGGKFPCI